MGRPTTLSSEAKAILANVRIEGTRAYLPPGLARSTYVEIDKCFKALNGAWNRSAKCHIFEDDPSAELRAILDGGGRVVDPKTQFQFFPTPPALARRVAGLALDEAPDGPCRVLEPSAGDGALARAILDVRPDAELVLVEVQPRLAAKLRAEFPKARVIEADCLSLTIDDIGGPVQRCVMNPPFHGGADFRHVEHAFAMLSDGGELVSIMSRSVVQNSRPKALVQFREKYLRYGPDSPLLYTEDVPAGEFSSSGTEVATVIVSLLK